MTGERDGVYRFVRHEHVLDYLKCGWVVAFDPGPTHGHWSTAMRWLCACQIVDPDADGARRARQEAIRERSAECGWTYEAEVRLSDLLGHGSTRAQAACILNKEFGTTFTRNAISGKAARLGLGGQKIVRKIAIEERRKQRNAWFRNQRAAKAIAGERKRASPRARAAQPQTPPVGHSAPVPFLDRRPWQCSFPLWGDERFPVKHECCGAPVEVTRPSQLCAHHARISFRGHGQAH